MRWRLLTIKLQRKMNIKIKNKTTNEGLSEPSHKADVLVAQLKYTKNLYKNWIFRKFKYARKKEFYAPIICFG